MKKSPLLFAVIISFCCMSYISYSQAPNWLWGRSAGGPDFDVAKSVAVDASGNIYMVGYFLSSTITFGFGTYTNMGVANMFLVKYAPDGNVLWAESAGGEQADVAYSVAVDASGNIYIAGSFSSSTITFDSITLTNAGGDDIFLVKYAPDGNVIWAKSAGGKTDDIAYSIAVDASGNSYLAGSFKYDTIIFGSDTLTNQGITDMFLVKYAPDGNVLWAKSAGGESYDEAYSVAVDTSGNISIAGYFESRTITFDSDTLTNTSTFSYDIFIAKYAPDGNMLWAKSAGGTGYDAANSVAVDASGNSYIVGYFDSSKITFGSDTLWNMGHKDMFVAKYDVNGNALWAKSAGGTSYDVAFSVTGDASDNIYVTGNYGSVTITFGSYTFTHGDDIFLVKYAPDGNVLWAKTAEGTRYDAAYSVAVDVSGNNYVAGVFWGSTIIFGSDTLMKADTNNTSDIFLAKSDGSYTGINELNNSLNISVFPNPATDKVTIESLVTSIPSTLTIMNLNGQELISRQISEPKTQIDVSNLPVGVYFVRVINDKTVEVGKIIKK